MQPALTFQLKLFDDEPSIIDAVSPPPPPTADQDLLPQVLVQSAVAGGGHTVNCQTLNCLQSTRMIGRSVTALCARECGHWIILALQL